MKYKQEGFSVVEVLIAMAILAIGIMAVMRLFPSGLGFSRMAQQRTVAVELAGSTYGRVKMAGASNMLAMSRAAGVYKGNAALPAYTQNMTELGIGSRYSEFRDKIVDGYVTSVTRVGGPMDQKLLRVTFMVDMPDGRKETFVTYVTDY